MLTLNDYDFDLPTELIAQYPLAKRSASKLLCLNKNDGKISHHIFNDLPQFLQASDLLIFNDTKVIPARLTGVKNTGGKVEMLIERILGDQEALAHIRANKSLKIGNKILIMNNYEAEIVDRQDDLFYVKFNTDKSLIKILEEVGKIPLPPYINRAPEELDKERYQTIFAKHNGAVAAPTAALHFDSELTTQLQLQGVNFAFITLHVGAGTFQPIRGEDISSHKMHAEHIEVSEAVCAKINETKKNGGRIIAVGTTTVRSLETAAESGSLRPYRGETEIFIYPGYRFQCIDAMITNFHLPKSTLLLLISAFAGYNNIKHAYQEAVAERYRFFSYGDAMFIN